MHAPFLSCVHSHTDFCDGKDRPEVMVRRAMELGFVSLGISSHGPTWWADQELSLHPERVGEYQAQLRRLDEACGDRLEVLVGVEHDALTAPVGEGFDYVIESVHALEVDGQVCFVDFDADRVQQAIHRCFGDDPYAYARAYFRACAEAYLHNPAQIAGHLDLVSKFQEQVPMFDEQDPRYLDAALEAADCALECGLVLEVNTGAIARGYRTSPYPALPILRHLRQRNAPVVVTSDCHDARFLDCWYDQTAELLKAVGFRSTLRLRKSGWEEIGLE